MSVGTVIIPDDVYGRVRKRVESSDFKSVDDYVTYVLRQVLDKLEGEQDKAYSKADEELVKARLRSLGYMD